MDTTNCQNNDSRMLLGNGLTERIRYVVMFVLSKKNRPILQQKPFAPGNDSVSLFRRHCKAARNRGIRRGPTRLCPNLSQHTLRAFVLGESPVTFAHAL